MAEVEKQAVFDEETRTGPKAEVMLRFLLFVSSVVAVLVVITSKQTATILVTVPPFPTPFDVVGTARFRYSPAFIYFIIALSVTGLYSIITAVLTFLSLLNHKLPNILLAHIIVMDVILLGILSAATGTAGAIAYLGLKGNSHTNWMRICYRFDKFCIHIATSVSISLFASIILVFLILHNIYVISKKIPK